MIELIFLIYGLSIFIGIVLFIIKLIERNREKKNEDLDKYNKY